MSNTILYNVTTLYLIGKPGSGKTLFGNLYLGNNSSSPENTILYENGDQIGYNITGNSIKYVIETNGFRKHGANTSIQASNIFSAIKNHLYGITAVALVIPMHKNKLSNSNKQVLRLLYESFKTDEIFYKMGLIFTYHAPKEDDRYRQSDYFKNEVEDYLTRLTGRSRSHNIKAFFVDNVAYNRLDVQYEIPQIRNWVSERSSYNLPDSLKSDAIVGYWQVEGEFDVYNNTFEEKIDDDNSIFYSNFINKTRNIWMSLNRTYTIQFDWEIANISQKWNYSTTIEYMTDKDIDRSRYKVEYYNLIKSREKTTYSDGRITYSDWKVINKKLQRVRHRCKTEREAKRIVKGIGKVFRIR